MFDMAKSALDSLVEKEVEEGSEILADLKLELEEIWQRYNDLEAAHAELKKACLGHCDVMAKLKDLVSEKDEIIKKQKAAQDETVIEIDGYKAEK